VGLLGGLIGLGGAEFRLLLLIGLFGLAALQAVIMNKAMSLIVVVNALPARLVAVAFDAVSGYWFVVVNLLAGTLIGAWIGATWATRMRSATLYRVLARPVGADRHRARLESLWRPQPSGAGSRPADPAGASGRRRHRHRGRLMGVAGGELLIPTIVLLFPVDIKIAGSLTLVISLPPCSWRSPATAATAASKSHAPIRLRARHGGRIDHRQHPRRSCPWCRPRKRPLLVALLLVSSVKVWRHD
jgi:hypothetical protein